MTFTIDEEQRKKISEWKAAKEKVYTGACGGRYTYQFSPTSLGCVVVVIDEVTKEELDVTDYNW